MNHDDVLDIPLSDQPMLPGPQGSALAILQASKSGATGLGSVLELAAADPVLYRRLHQFMQTCAADRGPQSASEYGLASMGPVAVKNIALVLSLVDQYSAGLCVNFDYLRHWSESLLMGFVMKELVALAGRENACEMGSWAMLCRVGCLGLATAHPIQYGKLLRTQNGLDGVQAAQDTLQTNHLSLGVSLLTDWGLPDHLLPAVIQHEAQVFGPELLQSADPFWVDAMHLSYRVANRTCRPDTSSFDIGFDQAVQTFQVRHGLVADSLKQSLQRATNQTLAYADAVGMELCRMVAASPNTAREKVAVIAQSQLKILIIEDDPILKRLLTTWLTVEIGHTLISASNGEEALVLAEHHLPQVIITDWLMPAMDGIAFCKALRRTPWGAGMYVLMLTSASGDEDLVQAFEAGVDDFQSKPFNRRALGARLRAAWRYVQLRSTLVRENERLQRDNSELELSVRRLQLNATQDALTDLANRRAGQVAIAQGISTGQRYGMQMCVIALEIDFFRVLASGAGREAANEVLQQVAMTLRQAARVEDTVCRWSDEIFMLVAPGLRLDEGVAAAQRFRSLIANHQVLLESVAVGVTVSVGVACWDSESKIKDQLINEAYQALDAAKEAGGNRVCML